MTSNFRNPNSLILRSLLCGCALVIMLVTAASATATSSVQVQIGSNAPVGRILSLELTLNSVQLVSTKGVAVSLVSRPFTLEQSHLGASAEVVGRATIPFGTYNKALLTVANPHVIFLDNFGNIREVRWTGAVLSTVALKQPASAGSVPSVIRISLDIASLMRFDSAHQTMSRAPSVFTVSQLFPARVGADADVAGELEATVGKVSSVAASSFTIVDAVGSLTTTYWVDRNTAYNGLSLRTMLNLFVRVHSITRADGQLLAHDVSVSGSGGGSVLTGVITDPAAIKIAAHQVYGAGASSNVLGALATVTLDPAASFQLDSRGMDLSGLSLTFDRGNLVAGQRIQFINRGSMSFSSTGASMSQAMTARLQLQVISGTVSNISVATNGSASFDLQLPPNDGSILSSSTDIVHVVTQPLTRSPIATLTEGMPVKVRGLLLFDASSQGLQGNSARAYIANMDRSNYYLVARSIQRDNSNRN